MVGVISKYLFIAIYIYSYILYIIIYILLYNTYYYFQIFIYRYIYIYIYIPAHSIIFTILIIDRYPKKSLFVKAPTFLKNAILICLESPISNQMFLSQTVFPRSPILAQILYFYPRILLDTPFPNFRVQFGPESPVVTQKFLLLYPLPLKAPYSPKVSLQISTK